MSQDILFNFINQSKCFIYNLSLFLSYSKNCNKIDNTKPHHKSIKHKTILRNPSPLRLWPQPPEGEKNMYHHFLDLLKTLDK